MNKEFTLEIMEFKRKLYKDVYEAKNDNVNIHKEGYLDLLESLDKMSTILLDNETKGEK